VNGRSEGADEAPRINVLQVLGNAIVGGMETSVQRLAERLPAHGVRVTAVAPFESAVTERLRAGGVEVTLVPLPEDPLWSSLQLLGTLVRAQAIDVLHAHLHNAHLTAGIVGRLTGKPVLATVHGRSVTLADLEAQRLTGTHLAVVCKHSYFHALGLGVDAARLHLIPNGVDLQAFAPRARDGALRREWNVPANAPLAAFVGRLSPEKAPDVFLRALPLVRERVPQAHFVVVGDGPMRAALESARRHLALDHVHFAGARGDMPAVYAEVDVVACTSHSEAMPLAVLEAMASGVPVVATRVGGVPDLVDVGRTGLLVEPGDGVEFGEALASLLADADRRAAMSAAARHRAVAHFALDAGVAATAQLLRRLAQPRNGERRVSSLAAVKPAGIDLAERRGKGERAGA
jgi:glycosyltransferase involved in cell wall biosynthesis